MTDDDVRIGYRFAPVPEALPASWGSLSFFERAVAIDAFRVSHSDGLAFGACDWQDAMCFAMAIPGRDRPNVKRALGKLRDMRIVSVEDGRVSIIVDGSQCTSDQRPTNVRSTSDQHPVNVRSTSDQHPVNVRSTSGQHPVNVRSTSDQHPVNIRNELSSRNHSDHDLQIRREENREEGEGKSAAAPPLGQASSGHVQTWADQLRAVCHERHTASPALSREQTRLVVERCREMARLHDVEFFVACKKLAIAAMDACAEDKRAKFAFVALEIDPFSTRKASDGLDPALYVGALRSAGGGG